MSVTDGLDKTFLCVECCLRTLGHNCYGISGYVGEHVQVLASQVTSYSEEVLGEIPSFMVANRE